MTTLVLTLTSFIKTLVNHLWLSVSSARFYQNVFSSYQGYGTKYIFTLSIISALMCDIVLLNYADKIQKYLSEDIISRSTINIDHVIAQLPTINYDGKNIAISEDFSSFIYDVDNVKLLAIDPLGKLSHNEKMQVPFLLMKDQMIINLSGSDGKMGDALPVKYTQVFGSEPQVLTKENIKSSFATLLKKSSNMLTYIGFPILSVLIFINSLLEKSFMMVVVYIISRLGNGKSGIKDCIRVVLFSNGLYTLFQFVISLTFKELSYGLWVIQIWINILMVIGIMRSQGRTIFFSK